MQNVDALHAECQAADLPSSGAPRLEAVEDKPWSMREFAIVDPNGNLVRVGQELASQEQSSPGALARLAQLDTTTARIQGWMQH